MIGNDGKRQRQRKNKHVLVKLSPKPPCRQVPKREIEAERKREESDMRRRALRRLQYSKIATGGDLVLGTPVDPFWREYCGLFGSPGLYLYIHCLGMLGSWVGFVSDLLPSVVQ